MLARKVILQGKCYKGILKNHLGRLHQLTASNVILRGGTGILASVDYYWQLLLLHTLLLECLFFGNKFHKFTDVYNVITMF